MWEKLRIIENSCSGSLVFWLGDKEELFFDVTGKACKTNNDTKFKSKSIRWIKLSSKINLNSYFHRETGTKQWERTEKKR